MSAPGPRRAALTGRRPRPLPGSGHPGNRGALGASPGSRRARSPSRVPWSCRRAGRRACRARSAPASAGPRDQPRVTIRACSSSSATMSGSARACGSTTTPGGARPTSASARARTCSPATTTGTTRCSASSASRSRSRTAPGSAPRRSSARQRARPLERHRRRRGLARPTAAAAGVYTSPPVADLSGSDDRRDQCSRNARSCGPPTNAPGMRMSINQAWAAPGAHAFQLVRTLVLSRHCRPYRRHVLLRISSLGLTFLLSIVLANALGSAGYGIYVLCMTWATLLSTLATLGLPSVAVRETARARATNDHKNDPQPCRLHLLDRCRGYACRRCGRRLGFSRALPRHWRARHGALVIAALSIPWRASRR